MANKQTNNSNIKIFIGDKYIKKLPNFCHKTLEMVNIIYYTCCVYKFVKSIDFVEQILYTTSNKRWSTRLVTEW